MAIDLRPATSLSTDELTELFNAGYEGYVIPFVLDERALVAMIDAFDIDLDASRVSFRDEEPVGFANLALRNAEAWVGGVGVVTAARRQGVAETLMRALHDEARARGVSRVWLEVIEENDAAYRLYEKLGYEVVRWFEVWTLTGEPGERAREVPVAQAHERIRALRSVREPWQRADETLWHYEDARGLETDGGAAVFRVDGPVVRLLQIAGDNPGELLRAMRALGTVSALNVPADDPVADALRDLGGSVAVRQREMVLSL